MCESKRPFPIKGKLLEALKSGDQRAWNRLILEESPCLKRWFRRRVPKWLQQEQPEQDDAGGGIVGELVDDTWIIVYMGVVGNEKMEVLHHAFIHKAAGWALSKRLRNEQLRRDKPFGAAGLDEDLLDAHEAPEAQAPAKSLDEYLDAAEPPLTEFERTVVKLRLEQDLKFREIAEQLNTSLSTVSGAWYRAIVKVAGGIGDAPDERP